jgi:uncharacterized oligopeptide transporter (OPT) family protein
MALLQLTEEQTRTWTRTQKDQWWFDNVFRGDMPQLTIRSALTGFLLGGILAATNLYVGAKTGVSLGVGVTSVILAFALFRAFAKAGAGRDFTILENNAVQSIATSAGYMTSPLISSLAAYMLVADRIVPGWQMVVWMATLALIGVLIAFPLKRRFINEEQLPFPEGRASGVVLEALYESGGEEGGVFKARALAAAAAIAGFFQFISGEGWMALVQKRLLRRGGEPWFFRERIDEYWYRAGLPVPRIGGIDVRQLGLRVGVDFALFGVGGLMGLRVSASVFIGSVVNFVVLAPIVIRRGEVVARGAAGITRGEIVNQWSLWWAVTMMVVGSLVGLLAKKDLFVAAWRMVRGGGARKQATDVLAHVELPLWISAVGLPPRALLAAWMAHAFFGASWTLALASMPLIFVLTIICTNSMALTSWTPTGALSKITQFTIGAFDRTNPATNLSAAGMTSEISANAANLLSDIKPGYMLGAKPRQQAIGHVIGIFSGALAATPLFFVLFLPRGATDPAKMVSDAFPFPAALQWKGVADLIARGLQSLPSSAVISMVVAALVAVAFEVARIVTKGRFPLSPVSIGLGVVLPPDACLAMFAGALFFDGMSRRHARRPGTRGHELWVGSVEAVCSGFIAGAALTGIGNALLVAFLD